MNTKKLAVATAAMVFVLGAGANAFASDSTHAIKTITAKPHTTAMATTTAAAQPFAGDTLVLDQGLLTKVEHMTPADRAKFVKEREAELAKMPASDKAAVEQGRQQWYSALPAEKQKEFTSRLDKMLESLGLKKPDLQLTK